LLIAGILATGGACGEPKLTAPKPPPFVKPTGSYFVVSRDGVPMRIALPDSGGFRRELAIAELILRNETPHFGDETFTVIVFTSSSGQATLHRRRDGLVTTMLSPSTMRLAGASYVAGTATIDGDSVIVVESDSAATLGRHSWRLRRPPS